MTLKVSGLHFLGVVGMQECMMWLGIAPPHAAVRSLLGLINQPGQNFVVTAFPKAALQRFELNLFQTDPQSDLQST